MDVFSAIADPSRRSMLDMLAMGERPAGDLVKAFPRLTQPAVSRHLRVLRESGLVDVRVNAQRRIYTLRPDQLRELDQWLRHRLRAIHLKHWCRGTTTFRELVKLGASRDMAAQIAS